MQAFLDRCRKICDLAQRQTVTGTIKKWLTNRVIYRTLQIDINTVIIVISIWPRRTQRIHFLTILGMNHHKPSKVSELSIRLSYRNKQAIVALLTTNPTWWCEEAPRPIKAKPLSWREGGPEAIAISPPSRRPSPTTILATSDSKRAVALSTRLKRTY